MIALQRQVNEKKRRKAEPTINGLVQLICMNKIIAKVTVNFGKIAFNYSGRKRNAADVEIELRQCGGEPTYDRNGTPTGRMTPKYTELAIVGQVWNSTHTDIVMGGQCLDSMKPYIHSDLFNEVYELWAKYHLNGMHAGTPEQEAAIKAREERIGRQLTYDEQCELLKEAHLYEVEYTGPAVGRMYDHEPYVYGHAWLIQDLPDDVIRRVMEIAKENGGYVSE